MQQLDQDIDQPGFRFGDVGDWKERDARSDQDQGDPPSVVYDLPADVPLYLCVHSGDLADVYNVDSVVDIFHSVAEEVVRWQDVESLWWCDVISETEMFLGFWVYLS